MPIQKITIEEFLLLAKLHPVLDVRSPGEYAHAHIPTAHSLPLFSDEERKQVGTAYKQQSREAAIKIGLDYFGVKMKAMVEEVEKIIGNWQLTISNKENAINKEEPMPIANCILLHCWRGGMRSAAVAWLLDMYGFKVYLLVGGYKAYRKWVLAQFEKEYNFNIIGGYTGSGKTLVLHELQKQNKTILDLEGLANHKGSAFGALEGIPQPAQEMFENCLALVLAQSAISNWQLAKETNGLLPIANCQPPTANCIWLEDESQRIGNLQIPMPLWYTMRKSPVFFMDIPFEERLIYITEEYSKLKKQTIKDAIIRIQKRLGGLEPKNAFAFYWLITINGITKACITVKIFYLC
jgi:tRNA 2-selenouridine synthase